MSLKKLERVRLKCCIYNYNRFEGEVIFQLNFEIHLKPSSKIGPIIALHSKWTLHAYKRGLVPQIGKIFGQNIFCKSRNHVNYKITKL